MLSMVQKDIFLKNSLKLQKTGQCWILDSQILRTSAIFWEIWRMLFNPQLSHYTWMKQQMALIFKKANRSHFWCTWSLGLKKVSKLWDGGSKDQLASKWINSTIVQVLLTFCPRRDIPITKLVLQRQLDLWLRDLEDVLQANEFNGEFLDDQFELYNKARMLGEMCDFFSG